MAETSDQQSDDTGFTGFSQDDIDALLSGDDTGASDSTDTSASTSSPPSDDAASAADSAGGSMDQSDIDAMLNGGGTESSAGDAADAGSMDQSDIDAMLNGGGAESSESPEPQEASAAEMDQAEIDRLMSGDAPAPEPADAPAAPAKEERLDSMGRPFDEVAAAMQAAIEEEKAAAAASGGGDAPVVEPESLDLPDLGDGSNSEPAASRVTMLSDVKLRVRIQLGKTRMLVEDVLKLNEGSVVELDKLAGDPVDVIINDRLIARGEVLVLNDNFCIRICEVLSNDPHRITT